jgi:GDPmannose 4,6-dehydratase
MSTFQFNIATTELILRGLRKDSPGTRFYFAASSEMFGPTSGRPQNETSPLNPVSPYAVSKVAGFYLTRMYREAYGLHASSGIAFNHESPRRGASFVTRKIAHAAAAISLGRAKELRLGNLEVRRDWGFAGDYVDAMWRMLQKEQAADYVIGTGRNHALTEFLDLAFGHVGLDWHEHVVSDPELLRPLDIPVTLADPAKAGRELGWEPRASFEELIAMMVDAELERLSS